MNAPASPTTIAFAESELSGKMLALVVSQLESQKNPWSMTSEKNQETFLNNARIAMDLAVKQAVMTIATNRIPAVVVTLDRVVFNGDGIEAKLTMGKQIGAHELADAAGQRAYILLANPEAFAAGGEKVTAAKDQPDLPTVEAKPEIRKQQDKTFTVFKDGIPMLDGTGFKTLAAAEEWLLKLNAAPPAPDAKPPIPEIRKFDDGGYRIVVPDRASPSGISLVQGQPDDPFKTQQEAEAWLAKLNAPADHVPGQLPEIQPDADGFRIVIGEDKHRFPGAPVESFTTHAAAEKWLQEHLGAGKRDDPAPAVDPERPRALLGPKGGWVIVTGKKNTPLKGKEAPKKPFKTEEAAQKWLAEHYPQTVVTGKLPETSPFPPTIETPGADAEPPAPEPNLDEAIEAFRAAGEAEAKKEDDSDFDAAMTAVKNKYPPDFVEDNLAELESAFTNAFDAGLGN